MTRIKRLVFTTTDPERLAKFYMDVMGLTITQRARNGGISLTDGYLTLSLHPNKMNGTPSGFNNFGFEIEDNAKFAECCRVLGDTSPKKRPEVQHRTAYRGMDPDGNSFHLSTNG